MEQPNHHAPTLAYVAADAGVLCEPEVHQELLAIEKLGWDILPFAIVPAEHSPRAEFAFAYHCTTLGSAGPMRGALAGLAAAMQSGVHLVQGLQMLTRDILHLGWARPRSWAMVGRWLAATQLAGHLRASGCTHVHAHGASSPAQIAMYAASMCGIPFTCTAYDRDLFRHSLLLKEVATRSKCLITSSHYNKHWLEAQGVEPARIAVVRCSPRSSQAPKAAGERACAVTAPGQRLRTGPYRIGMMCSLLGRNGVDDVLLALAQLIRRGCAPVRLLIAGQGPERLRLQVLADRLGIHACVEFVGDIAPSAAGAWLRTLDLYVAASKPDRDGAEDGIPLMLVEAMAAGIPAVATRISGIPELVIEDRTGFLAAPGQPDSLAEQIDRAMSDPDRARSLAQAGRAHVRWEFGREQNLRRLVSHFVAPHAPSEAATGVEQAA